MLRRQNTSLYLYTIEHLANSAFLQEIAWSGKTKKMILNDIPDLRGEWWWQSYAEPNRKRVAEDDEIDWPEKLGGWDLMDLLKDVEETRSVWVAVDEVSCSFN